MLQKNIEKEKRKQRKNWVGYYSRFTPSKRDREIKEEKKKKNNYMKEEEK